MLDVVIPGILVGIAAELAAYTARLWRYRTPVFPLVNICLMFGLCMASVSLLVPMVGMIATFVVGFVIGYFYEWANFLWLGWWHFPNDKFLFFKGKNGCAFGVALGWGTVPLAIHIFSELLF